MSETKQVVGKYEFLSKNEFDIAFNLLFNTDFDGNKIPKFYFSEPVHVIIPNQNTYNVDMCWWLKNEYHNNNLMQKDHPYGWGDYAIDLDNEGLHSFGISYLENKI